MLPRPSDLTAFQFPFIHSQIICFRTSPQFLLLFLYWLVIFPTEFLLKILRFFYPQGHDKPNFLAPTLPPSQMLMLCDFFRGLSPFVYIQGSWKKPNYPILLWMSIVLQIGSYSYPVNVMEGFREN